MAAARRATPERRPGPDPDLAGLAYPFKKDIRNHAIHRELDHDRHRGMWRSVAIGALFVAVLLFSAFQHFELLRYGYRLEQLQQQRAAEEEVNRHLRLEIETLRAPHRIERLATEKLQMVAPSHDRAIVIERVTAPEPPAKSIVAAR